MAYSTAVVEDVEARWRVLTSDEAALVTVLLDDAWLDIVTMLPSVVTRLDAGTMDPRVVVRVQAAMVVRVLRNPDGLKSYRIDDFTAVRDQVLSSGLLTVTPDELGMLAERGQRVKSVRLVAYDSVVDA